MGKNPSLVSWKKSFAVRFAIVWALVLGASVGVSGWLSYRESRQQLLGNLNEVVGQDSRVMKLRLETWLETLGNDTRSVSRSPVVREFLETRGTGGEQSWRGMVEDEFEAVFAGKPTYIQLRLLEVGGEREGREILRLDRKEDELVVTPPSELQEKGGRDYFQEALECPVGEVYLSEINLNREFGKITEPKLPTIRSAIRIQAKRSREVMLIINADLRLLFAELDELASADTEIFLRDRKGDYLMHPEEGARFATDLDRKTKSNPGAEESEILSSTKISTGHWPGRELGLQVALTDESWRTVLEQARARGLWTTILASLGGAALALVIAWFFSRRLRRLTRALRQFDGREDAMVVESDLHRDEIGVAIERFEEMAVKVREHVESLRRARKNAEEAEAAKEHFLAVMSHEIRTPMNGVVGLVRALEANDPPPQQKPILSSLQSSTNNLMTLLNTALDYTRLHEGAMRYEVAEFDVAELAREVMDALKPLAMGKNLILEVELPEVLHVKGDAVRLRQVLNNLLNNALKFTTEGFVKLKLRHEDGTLEGTVSDSGPGIARSECDDIFKPFYSHEDARGGGAGLGLSVSREMIEQQDGSLTLECPAEGGAVFRFRLPYEKVEKDLNTGTKGRDQDERFGEGRRVLYVEDTISNQEVMGFTLDGTGVELICVETGTEAVEICRREEFDLIMLDLQLPDTSGTALAKKLRLEMPQVPMVLVTAQVSAANDGRAGEAGIEEVLLKPYSREAVLEILKGHLETDFSAALKGIHPGDAAKAARLAKSMAREFQEAADELGAAKVDQLDEVCGRLRHRLTTALACFPLPKVEVAFDNMKAKKTTSEKEVAELVASLKEAATLLEKSA